MLRKIIQIDEDKCNGCGLCADACHEDAIGIVDGKAKLLRDDYCDGLGDCLPACPAGAISFIEREAAAYDEAAVLENKKKKAAAGAHPAPAGGCPGTRMRQMNRKNQEADQAEESALSAAPITSQLSNWPVQIKLAPIKAPYFDQAKLLIAADCTAFAYANFAKEIQKGKITLIGCPKLDPVDYSEKLTAILEQNDVKSVTIIRMEVPCCGGIQNAAMTAMKKSGKFIPWQVLTVSVEGEVL